METMAYKTDEKARGKRTISKLRAKVDPSHPNYMGEAWLSTPDGQAALRRIAAYDPGQATPGRSTVAAKLAIRKQLDSIKAIGEATKDTTDELLTRAQGKIPQKRADQTAAERKCEIDAALAKVPAMRAERKQMAALEAAERKAAGVGKCFGQSATATIVRASRRRLYTICVTSAASWLSRRTARRPR